MIPKEPPSLVDQSEVTLQLAAQESQEHLHGMQECYEELRKYPLRFRAYAVDDVSSSSQLKDQNSKILHLVRHGQGFHNLLADIAKSRGVQWTNFTNADPNNPYLSPEARDAPLTEKGRQQAMALRPRIRSFHDKQQQHLQPKLIVCSPCCRALQTGILAWQDETDVPILVQELVKEECGVHPCDHRRSKSEIAIDFPRVNLSGLLHEEDPYHRKDVRESKLEVAKRGYQFLEWLFHNRSPDETCVAVNSHSSWLLTLLNAVVETESDSIRAWFQTGEMRSVRIEMVPNADPTNRK
jgi:broad specificity phosphatase PhoE